MLSVDFLAMCLLPLCGGLTTWFVESYMDRDKLPHRPRLLELMDRHR